MNRRGAIETVLLLVLAGLGLFAAARPELIPGTAAHRAKRSAQATQAVSSATQRVADAHQRQGEEVSAGLTSIGRANEAAPSSPAKDFIAQEVPFLLGVSPYKASPAALVAAEQRRAAVMQGERDEARRLYAQAYDRADQLQRERDAATAALARAQRERQRVDQELAEAAAAEHARSLQLAGALLAAGAVAAAFFWLRFHSISLPAMGRIVADVRAGESPLQVFDRYIDHRLHPKVRSAAKLATEPKD